MKVIFIEQNVIVFKQYFTVHIFTNILVAFVLLEKHNSLCK